jgi:lysophospholipase L1-like esterase
MSPTASSRPRRSRAGLVVLVLLLALVAWEFVGRSMGAMTMTPMRLGKAAWKVAQQGVPPSEEDLALVAYEPLPYVNYGLKPNWTRKSRNADAPKKTSNKLGFRGREIEQPKPAGRYRIACLGGSTTYDDGVGDEDTYPVKLEGLLRAGRPGRDIEVVNCGVPSYTSAEDLANLAFRVLDLQPDAIVVYQGINDWRTRPYRNFDSAYFHYRKVWDGSLEHWARGKGDLGGDNFNINQLIQHDELPDNGDEQENERRSGPGAFRRNLESIAGIAKAHGAAVVMVSNIFDASNKFTPPDFPGGMAETNGVIRDVCGETGALFVDLDAKFPKGDQVPPGGLFVDPVHNNPAGAQIKARIIADAMLKDLLK